MNRCPYHDGPTDFCCCEQSSLLRTPADNYRELRACLELLVRQFEERSASLPGVPDLLCAIDKQTLNRAKRALEKTK